jgi:digeranylgeranylglycerophospholipid reductase
MYLKNIPVRAGIIGAGAIGLYLGKSLAPHCDVEIFEEDGEIGKPAHCSGLMSIRGLERIGVKPGALLNRVRGARIFSPNMAEIRVERKDYQAVVLDRAKYDQKLANDCLDLGVRIRKGDRIENARQVKADYVAVCEGSSPALTSKLGLSTNKKLVYCYQAEGRGEFEEDMAHVYFGKFAHGFFGWVIPLSEGKIRVGLGTSKGNAKECFESFIKRIRISSKWENVSGGCIPVGGPIARTVIDNICILGDAAGQVKATTGGGVIFGSECAKVAADCILKGDIKGYETAWREKLGPELKTHALARKILDRISDEGMNRMFRTLIRTGFKEVIEKHGDMDLAGELIRGSLSKPLGLLQIILSSPTFFL